MSAFTFPEVIVVIAVMALLIGFLLPGLISRRPSTGMACTNHLKQVGLAFRIFELDHGDRLHWQVATNDGGSREYLRSPNSAFRHFQVLSNELSTPRIIVCPKDRERAWASSWSGDFGNQNISYFVVLNASETNANSVLSGDRYLTSDPQPVNGFLDLARPETVTWTKRFHDYNGHLLLGDGSVLHVSSPGLQKAFRDSGAATNRLAIP